MAAGFGTVADLWDPCFLCDLCGGWAADSSVKRERPGSSPVRRRELSCADFAVSPTVNLARRDESARLIKVSARPEWSSTFGKLARETGKSGKAKRTLIMRPAWDLPI